MMMKCEANWQHLTHREKKKGKEAKQLNIKISGLAYLLAISS